MWSRYQCINFVSEGSSWWGLANHTIAMWSLTTSWLAPTCCLRRELQSRIKTSTRTNKCMYLLPLVVVDELTVTL